MPATKKDKIIIIATLNGGYTPFRGDGAYILPITPEEIAEETFKCYQAGAAIVHIHARDAETKLVTTDIRVFNESVKRIRERCDILIQTTTGMGARWDSVTQKRIRPSDEERMALLTIEPKQDLVSLPMGTLDIFAQDGTYSTFSNTPDFLRKNIPIILKKKFPWEMEIFDVSFLYNALRLAEEGIFDKNSTDFWLEYGVGFGGLPPIPRLLVYAVEEAKRIFPQAKWHVCARGKDQFPMLTLAMSMGCHFVRTGFEDNIYLPSGEIAKNNFHLVESAVKIAKDLGRDIATVAEAKEILGLVR